MFADRNATVFRVPPVGENHDLGSARPKLLTAAIDTQGVGEPSHKSLDLLLPRTAK